MSSPSDEEKKDQLKIVRRQRKAAITRHLGTLRRLVAEEDSDGVETRLRQVGTSFLEFEASHNAYNEYLSQEELEESDSWFLDAEAAYTAAVTEARSWLKSSSSSVQEPKRHESKTVTGTSVEDLLNLMSIPKVELDVFNGDPLQYQTFFAVFDEIVHRKPLDDRVKLTRLLQYTSGAAKDSIRNCALLDADVGYQQARHILKTRFGDPHLVTQNIIRGLKGGRPVVKAVEIQQLGDELITAMITLEQLGFLYEINTQDSILGILQRCRPYIRYRWRDKALKSKAEIGTYPAFREFVHFIRQIAVEACDPVYGNDVVRSNTISKASAYNVVASAKYSCVVCGELHGLFSCDTFKGMTPSSRLAVVKKNKLCFNCLTPGHFSRECRKGSVCSVPGCGAKHTKFIHVNTNVQAPVADNDVNVNSNVSIGDSGTVVYLPIVPVVINGKHTCYALLDTGSTNTFITEKLASRLNLRGSLVNYQMNTLGGSDSVSSKLVSFKIESVDRCKSVHLRKVLVVPSIPVRYPEHTINVVQYPHLKGIPLHHVDPSVQADLLIGMDNSNILIPQDVRFNPENTRQPYATLTLLGWALSGHVLGGSLKNVNSNFVQLQNKLDGAWADDLDDSKSLSYNDRSVLDLWEREIEHVGGHYVLPIPWREGRPNLTNNRSSAMARLNYLLNRLHKNGMFEKYAENIGKLVSDGYAEPVPLANLNESRDRSTIWYLPHHAVLSESKPGKLRVVFDCAAQYGGVSLNNQCLQGPDLNNKLLHVLLRFRQFEYAIMADIEAMYHQVKIPLKDRDALRFLWSVNNAVVEFRMTSHLFGGVWCASSSTFALRKTVEDFPTSDSVKRAILKCFYVDDLLNSVKSRSEAFEIIHGCRSTLSKGGFNLTKFVLNDEELLQSVDVDHRAKEVRDITPDAQCKALGIRWDVSQDNLFYVTNMHVVSPLGEVTKRCMLSQLNSLYDPLGLLAPVTLLGRTLFQEAVRQKLGWDEMLTPSVSHKWQVWLESLSYVSTIRFPRCVIPGNFDDGAAELHHFSDASEVAYGACSYIRVINKKGEVHVALLASKARLAPLKPVTIPRLELMAAVTAVNLDRVIASEMDIPLLRSTFWTDSQICLAYIRNDTKRFKVFVANRVSVIRQLSEPSQWCYVKSATNPADVLSRGCNSQTLPSSWSCGPSFLSEYKSAWVIPEMVPTNLLDHDSEVKKLADCTHVDVEVAQPHPVECLIEYFSSFYRLKKAICYLLRLKNRLRKLRSRAGPITVGELMEAEHLLAQYVQQQSYEREIQALIEGKTVSKSSSLYKLSPCLDNDLLVVGGRLKHAAISERTKRPCILPSNHKLSDLIVRDYHGRAHLGTEWTLSHLRERFWITRARNLVKSVKRNCVTCKKLYGKPLQQKMADLLPEQVNPDKPPFSYVGVDLFGPFLVRYGRSMAKRYGCIFTCFTTRAVHLEVLWSLETDAFINGFMRFVSRRGCPTKIWSDNGTNLVGARKELSNSLKLLNRGKVVAAARRQMVDWTFNPPLASHRGGLWERMIRTVRKVLVSLLQRNDRLSDEVLSTVLCEVECIVNSRPLTKLSSDPLDEMPLTPNHLLLMRDNSALPWSILQESDVYRRRWRQVQRISSLFWSRWLKQYLPDLQTRQRWNVSLPNVKVGDLVLLVDENTPRGCWPLGIVTDVNYGRDNLVRSVKLRTRFSTFVRPVTKLVLLEGVYPD